MKTELSSADRFTLQTLARHQMITRLLADINHDMMVCLLEGWDIFEFPQMIHNETKRILEMREKW